MTRKFVSIVGARPQFIKVAPLSRILDEVRYRDEIDHVIVHTGQHYDAGMSDVFFEELEIPRAQVNLGVGSGLQGWQTGRMLEAIEAYLRDARPDLVIVYGDTNSTLAGTLAAVKLHLPVAHLEAGLRSFNRAMPEEINRVVADHTADQLLAPTRTAVTNLSNEGLAKRTVLTGDIMHDALRFNRVIAQRKSKIIERLDLQPQGYGVVTIHRAENTDDGRLENLLDVLNHVASNGLPLVFPVHPRTARCLQHEYANWRPGPDLQLIEPLGYLDMLMLVDSARLVLTDSGGLQKEAFFLSRPCVTLRAETEWLETVEGGGNIVAGVDSVTIEEAVQHWLTLTADGMLDFSVAAGDYFGPGNAANISLEAMYKFSTSQR
jgi:UDP-N-acetylglucosamine 2-epimerase